MRWRRTFWGFWLSALAVLCWFLEANAQAEIMRDLSGAGLSVQVLEFAGLDCFSNADEGLLVVSKSIAPEIGK